jgi:hypothetical protein
MNISAWLPRLVLSSLAIVTANPILIAHSVTITDPSYGLFNLSGGTELSGITYDAGNNKFYAVSDSVNAFYPLNIDINFATGQINSATIDSPININITGTQDFEGIAYNPVNNSVFIASEANSSIKEYSFNATELSTVNVPNLYQNIRPNLGLESLTRQADGSLWTANEEALNIDGDRGIVANQNTIVRLQKFQNLDPVSQWAYAVEAPIPQNPSLPSMNGFNGVSDLLALPNGELLILEREASTGIPGFQSRIFLVDFNGATDISNLTGGLDGKTFTSVSKTLLWQSNFLATNFEGLTLGPQLDNGDYSLILVSDNGSSLTNSLLALTISGVDQSHTVPEPSLIMAVGIVGTILVLSKKVEGS